MPGCWVALASVPVGLVPESPFAAVLVLPVAAVLVTVALIFNGVIFERVTTAVNAAFSLTNNGTPEGLSAPSSSLRSGSPTSLLEWDSLGFQGRAFVGEGPDATRIAAVAKQAGEGPEQTLDPIRAYAGLDSAPDVEARAALAVQDLERAGGFGESLGSYGGEAAFSGEFDMSNRLSGALFTGPPSLSADLGLAMEPGPGFGHNFAGEHVDAWAQVLSLEDWSAERSQAVRGAVLTESRDPFVVPQGVGVKRCSPPPLHQAPPVHGSAPSSRLSSSAAS